MPWGPPADAAAPAAAVTPPTEPPARGFDAPSAVLDSELVDDWGGMDEPQPAGRFAGRRPRRRSGPRRPRGKFAARAFAGAALLGVVFAIWFFFSLFQPFHGAGSTPVALTIPKGASAAQAGRVLADKGVVASAFFFKLRAKLKGGDIKPGRYHLPQGMSYADALNALQKGPPKPKTTSITITEGRTRLEASALLKKTSLMGSYAAATVRSPLLNPRAFGAPKSVHDLEGFLFPATYTVREGGSVSDLVAKQLQTFKQRFSRIDLRYARSKHLTAYDVLIIASMIEREASTKRDRPLIASVLYNRLKQGEPLGIDATLRYVLRDQTRALTQSDLALQSPYNTRIHQGLPPTPIGNPGIASIQAAAHPANTKFLFFVVKPCGNGEHAFSTTLSQFNSDAAKYNQARDAKGGRSPVKC